MSDCGFCGESFSSKVDQLEHELEEHEDELSGHDRDDKKSELNKLREKSRNRKQARKRKLKYGAVGVLLLGVLASAGFYVSQNWDSISPAPVETNESAGVGTPVHWHANYEITVCGENRILQGGPTRAHTHGEPTFHLEGVRKTREQATLDWVVDQLGGNFSNDGIFNFREPESCPGSSEPGNLTVRANGEELDNPEDYIIRDGDSIEITYG